MASKNIMIIGVGGQGTPLINRILGKLTIEAGFDMKLSGAHGMVQRGGDMVIFVRYGEEMAEPIVEEGQADVLIASRHLEALRYLHFLKKGGVVIVSDWCIDPITVVTGVVQYPEGIVDRSKETRRAITTEATEEAKETDASRAFNVITLGAAIEHIGFEKEDWLKVTETTVPPKTVEINREAFETGYASSVQADRSRSNRSQSDGSREIDRRVDCRQIRDIRICHVKVREVTGR